MLCAFITDSDLLITSGLARIRIINTAAPVHFATHLSDRWRDVDMIQIRPLESFCALNPTIPACSSALCCAELSWPGRGTVQPYQSRLQPQLGRGRVSQNHQNYHTFLSAEPFFLCTDWRWWLRCCWKAGKFFLPVLSPSLIAFDFFFLLLLFFLHEPWWGGSRAAFYFLLVFENVLF